MGFLYGHDLQYYYICVADLFWFNGCERNCYCSVLASYWPERKIIMSDRRFFVLLAAFLLVASTFGAFFLSLGSNQDPIAAANTAPVVDDIDPEPDVPPASDLEGQSKEESTPEAREESRPATSQSVVQTTPKQTSSPSAPTTSPDVVRALGDNSSGAKTQYETYEPYQETIVGTCPSEREPNEWEVGDRMAAVGWTWSKLKTYGYKEGLVNTPMVTAERYMLGTWDYYMRGSYGGGDTWSMALYYVGYPEDDRYYRTRFVFDLATLTITAEGIMADDPIVQKHAAFLTQFVREVDAQYRAKCPNN